MASIRSHRMVVGARGDDERARLVARAMLMSGREVVFIGGDQSVEQVARTVVSEDASVVLLDATADDLDRLGAALRHAGLDHVEVSAVHVPDATDGV